MFLAVLQVGGFMPYEFKAFEAEEDCPACRKYLFQGDSKIKELVITDEPDGRVELRIIYDPRKPNAGEYIKGTSINSIFVRHSVSA